MVAARPTSPRAARDRSTGMAATSSGVRPPSSSSGSSDAPSGTHTTYFIGVIVRAGTLTAVRRQLLVLLAGVGIVVTMLASPGSASGRRPGAGPTTTLPEAPTPTANTPVLPIPNLGAVRTKLVQVGTVEMPTAMAVRAGDSLLYFAEKGGRVRTLEGRLVLDLSREVSDGDERGLLGLVFSP